MATIAVCINGNNFHINCPEGGEEAILSLADYVNDTIGKIAPKCQSMNDSALLSFTLLSMADEIHQLKTQLSTNSVPFENTPPPEKEQQLQDVIAQMKQLKSDITQEKQNLTLDEMR